MTRPGFQVLLSIDQQQQCTYPVRLQSQFASCSGRFSTRTMLNCGVSSSKAMESCRRSNWAKNSPKIWEKWLAWQHPGCR